MREFTKPFRMTGMILRPARSLGLAVIALCLAGCGTLKYERARFDGTRVENPTFGRGIYYRIPEGYAQLNPWSPVPPKPKNLKFEKFLRDVVAVNDAKDPHTAFREAMLFRNDDRYLVIIHVAMNMPRTFSAMGPGQRAKQLPALAAESYRYFNVPREDFDYTFRPLSGYTAIIHPPFRTGASSRAGELGQAGEDWRGIGCSFMGAVKDVAYVYFFARKEDLPLAESELAVFLAGFRYARP